MASLAFHAGRAGTYDAGADFSTNGTSNGVGNIGNRSEDKTDSAAILQTAKRGNQPPLVKFKAKPTRGAAGLAVKFSDSSTGTITNRFWDFGDGTTTNTSLTKLTHTYLVGGSNTVTLIASGPAGVSTNSKPDYIIATNVPPKAGFTGRPTKGSAPLTVNFTDKSTGTITNRFWDFGDGSTTHTSLTALTHIYPVGGSNTVSLIVSGPLGVSTNTMLKQVITFNVQPKAGFAVLPAKGSAPLQVMFTDRSKGTITNRFWDFGNGSTTNTTLTTFQKVYPTAGTNTVTLIVSGPLGVSGQTNLNRIIVVNAPPEASFTANPTNGFAPLRVTFTDTSTGTITNRFWDFGDGSTTNTSLTRLTHTYGAASTQTVVLVCSGPLGVSTNTNLNYILVTNAPPLASFTGSPLTGSLPLRVTFTDTSTGTITNRSWDFGDGSITNTSLTRLTHTYPQAGSNTVTLIASGPVGLSTNSKLDYIIVTNVPPLAIFTADPLTGSLPLQVTFTDTSTGTITNRFWNFGDGSTTNTSLTRLTHTYPQAGSNTVTLIASGPAGLSTNSKLDYIIVTNVPPVAMFTGIPTTGAAPLNVTFTDTSTGTITDRFWSFGDGLTTNTTLTTVMHTYLLGGTNSVTLIAHGPAGASTNSRLDYIIATNVAPRAGFTATPTNGAAPLVVTFTDRSTGTITNRFWELGDGSTLDTTLTTHVHTYTTPGTNTVKLTVYGPLGSNTITRSKYIVASSVLAAAALASPLVIHIDSPTNGTVTTARFIDVAGSVDGGQPPVSVITVRNRGGSVDAALGGAHWAANRVLLKLGTNQLFTVAQDTASNQAADIVTIIYANTNYVNTTLRVTTATLSLGATADSDHLTLSGIYNDAGVTFNPSNLTMEVLLGEYEALLPSNAWVNLTYSALPSPTDPLSLVTLNVVNRTFSMAASGSRMTRADPFVTAIAMGSNDLGPDEISFGISNNATGTHQWQYGTHLPNVNQFFLGTSRLSTNRFRLAGTLNILAKPDVRTNIVGFGIGAYDETFPTNGWVKGTANVYTYTRPRGHTGPVRTMTLDFDRGVWRATGRGADLGFLTNGVPTDVRLEIGDFAASYRAALRGKRTKFTY